MNINEACRYSNILNNYINQVEYLLTNSRNYSKTIEYHYKGKSLPTADDEVIQNEVDRVFNCKVNDLAYLITKLINQKLQLALAIEDAKKNLVIPWEEDGKTLTLDSAYEYNKLLRNFANRYLSDLTRQKPSILKTTGRAYTINVEGNQTPYTYDIETKTELDYDKDVVKDLYKKLLEKADKISTLIDNAMIADIVKFTPEYDIHDSLDDIITKYEATIK